MTAMVRTTLASLLAACLLPAAVKSVHTLERVDYMDGKSFGSAGAYERITAKAAFTVDPKLPANQIITDIDLAPRNAEGLVEFSADIYVLKPRDPKSGNGTILFEVSNRGGKGMLGMFGKEANDTFLFERGYTLVWVGWQFDVPDRPELIRLYTPSVPGVTGLVRSEFIPDNATVKSFSLADRNHMPYPVSDPNHPATQLTVRDTCDGARTVIPRGQWKFSADNMKVELSVAFFPGKVYEAVYQSANPPLVGLGPTAVRDFISYLKYGTPTAGINTLGDQRQFLKRAIGFGTSQSGRFLRTFMFYGFNADEQGRKVFDGVWAHVAGGGRGSFNHRFAQPSRDGHPHLNCLYPTDIFPFTDRPESDPVTGLSGGILDKLTALNAVPKVFYTNSSYEYWGRSAGLIHSTIDGKDDFELAPTTRAYMFAGTQHGPGSFPPSKGATQNSANANDYRWHMRALLTAMTDWIKDGKEPPPTAVPQVKKDSMVSVAAVNWPKIPSSTLPQHPQKAYRADYGPEFRTKGIVTQEPPKVSGSFATLVSQVDGDGNETAGIRHPMIQVPLGTYTGWNLRKPEIGSPEEMFSMVGSTFFFPKTKAEKRKTGDPRLSIEERYKNK